MVRKILLVDDDHDDAALFGEVSESIGSVEFQHAVDGQEALLLLTGNRFVPDILFLDINMPVLNGWQCLQSLRKFEQFLDLPVVMYSTSSHEREVELAQDLGATAFLTKPDSYRELHRLVELFVATPVHDWAIIGGNSKPAATRFFLFT